MTLQTYGASPIKFSRRRATKAEMEKRAEFLVDYAEQHGPITVRGLYYQAEVAGIPGIDKTDGGYDKVQAQVLKLRRSGRLSYEHIADATRWMRKPRTYNGIENALEETARLYRKSLWADADAYVEIWLEKDALAGVVVPVTSKFDVPLMVTRGYSSETFAYEAVDQRGDDGRDYVIYYFGDFDRAGVDAARSLHEKLDRFAADCPFRVIFRHMAITEEQIRRYRLPTRSPKRESAADRKWPHSFACELDAMEPGVLRSLVQTAIERHLPPQQYAVLKEAEKSERELLTSMIATLGGAA
jgi:hypothetical protein